jgi:hypothetical protein
MLAPSMPLVRCREFGLGKYIWHDSFVRHKLIMLSTDLNDCE